MHLLSQSTEIPMPTSGLHPVPAAATLKMSWLQVTMLPHQPGHIFKLWSGNSGPGRHATTGGSRLP